MEPNSTFWSKDIQGGFNSPHSSNRTSITECDINYGDEYRLTHETKP